MGDFLFCNQMVSVTFVSSGRFFRLMLPLDRRKTATTFVNMALQSIFQFIIIFHCLSVLNARLRKKIMVLQDYHADMLIDVYVQSSRRVCKKLCSKSQRTHFS